MTRTAQDHPAWCDRTLCTADQRGMHRAAGARLTTNLAAGIALALHLVLFARFDERQTLLVLVATSDGLSREHLLGRYVATHGALPATRGHDRLGSATRAWPRPGGHTDMATRVATATQRRPPEWPPEPAPAARPALLGHGVKRPHR